MSRQGRTSRGRRPGTGLRGKRVTVMGLGRFGGGAGVTRWLTRQGSRVTVSDLARADELAGSVAALEGLDLTLHLGRHRRADFTDCELLVINPAVPFDSPYVAAARQAGTELTTEINLFLARCPATVVGVTGSAGKSTTTAMAGAILSRHATAHVGGNIGGSLLESLHQIDPTDVVVLELSSFQLAWLPLLARSPQVAVVTNLYPNHLDRHASLVEYADAKKNIFRFQRGGDLLILNRDDPVADWAGEATGKVQFFSADDEPFELQLPGRHNQANAQAAWAATRQLGVAREVAAAALREFQPLPHRMQLVAERGGVRYYNDSKCTTPAEALAVLQSFPPKSAVVIVGGYDKKLPLEGLCDALAARAKAVVATGQTGESIARGVEAAAGRHPPRVVRAPQFDAAVRAACELAESGDVVLLAPACASFDQFRNFQQRGEAFIRLLRQS